MHTILGNHRHRWRTQKAKYPMNVNIHEEVPKMREWQQTSMMYEWWQAKKMWAISSFDKTDYIP